MQYNTGTGLSDLPPELVQLILVILGKPDLKDARLVCSSFAQLALEGLFDRTWIVHRSSDFTRLCKIAESPDIARCVRSFQYQADIFLGKYGLLDEEDDLKAWKEDCRFWSYSNHTV